jgi:hypothetical protein
VLPTVPGHAARPQPGPYHRTVTADRLPRTVFPLAAVGSMALTAYAGGIVAVAVIGTLDYTTRDI